MVAANRRTAIVAATAVVVVSIGVVVYAARQVERTHQTGAVYDSVVVDSSGQLHIRTTAHREILPAKDSDQVGFDAAAISPDRRAVGWLALYPNCCTSYPIPLRLVILSDGGRRVFDGGGLAIWRWHFDSGGTRVAYLQDVVHGGVGGYYELRDLATGGLIATFHPIDSVPMPRWVAEFARPVARNR